MNQRKYTSLYEKDKKLNQNSWMETTDWGTKLYENVQEVLQVKNFALISNIP